MTESKSKTELLGGEEEEVKWDYTTSEGTRNLGIAVIGGNLLIVLIVILYKTVTSLHTFISGKPL